MGAQAVCVYAERGHRVMESVEASGARCYSVDGPRADPMVVYPHESEAIAALRALPPPLSR